MKVALGVAIVSVAAAACTSSGQSTTAQTAVGVDAGTGVAHAVRGSVGPDENLGATVPAPPGVVGLDFTHRQLLALKVGQSRKFDLDVHDGADYVHPLHLQAGSKPGIVWVQQTGGTGTEAPLSGTITGAAAGSVVLEGQSDAACFHDPVDPCMQLQFTFTLSVHVVP